MSARIQDAVARPTKDGRKYMGVSHVVVITRSKYGRIFLGACRASQGEPLATVNLTDQVVNHAGDGLHVLVFDKGLQSWPTEYLMAQHGMLAVTPCRLEKKTDPETHDAELDAKEAIRRSMADRDRANGKEPKTNAQVPTDMVTALAAEDLNDRYQVKQLRKLWKRGFSIGAGLPLGQSQYINSAENLVQTTTSFLALETFTHELWVDDGALWEAEPQAGRHIKTQRLACVEATAVHNGTQYELAMRHQLVCGHTGEVLALDTRFKPRTKRGPVDNTRAKRTRALAALRPVAPCDPRWRKVYNIRNDIESWFSWFKARLLADKRAASLDVNHQLLDVLYAGMIQNSLTLRTYRLEQK